MKYSHLHSPVLVVDDEEDIRSLMEMTLMKMGLSVDTAVGVEDAKHKINQKQYALVLTDMRMPDGSGLEVVQYLNQQQKDTPIAVITAFGNASQAQEALRYGAFDYLQKPITLVQLRTLVKSALNIDEPKNTPTYAVQRPLPSAPTTVVQTPNESAEHDHADDNVSATSPTDSLLSAHDLPRLLGHSQQMEEVRSMIRRLANSNVSVYISGESGSGKEQAARSIHECSSRANQAFVAVNCGAIPENLMESEFFGYKKGSFTGADSDKNGFFQHAHGGTLFLDEVADLPLSMQVKLLRVIQEKSVRRIGDVQEQKVDVRLLCATHKNLDQLVEKGLFRQDLYYRLNVVRLNMPPLREIREDLEALIQRLLQRFGGKHQYTLSPAAKKALLTYSYPGNFRELENILERAIALCSNNTIHTDDLQLLAIHDATETTPIKESLYAHSEPSQSFCFGKDSIQEYLDDMEKLILQQALSHTQNNRTQAAKLLGITFRSMRYRLDRLGID